MENGTTVINKKTTSLIKVVLLLALPILIILGVIYIMEVQPSNEKAEAVGKTIEKVIGLSTPIVGGNHLAAEYTDADGDLVADAPTDPAKLVDPPTLFFSYIAQEEPEKARDAWKPFVDYLSKVTGKPVEYKLFTDTATQLKALHDGQLHVTGFNSGAVPTAVDAAGFVPICLVPGVDGQAITSSAFIVPANSKIKSLSDIRGHEMTYTHLASNSGFKAPILTLIEKANLRPGVDYNIRYSQGHEQSIIGIAKGEYEVAAVASDMLQRAVMHGDIQKDGYRILYESETFPTSSIGEAYNLTPELAKKIHDALLTFDWKGTALEKELASTAKTTFLTADYKNEFSLLRKIDDVTGTVHELK